MIEAKISQTTSTQDVRDETPRHTDASADKDDAENLIIVLGYETMILERSIGFYFESSVLWRSGQFK